MGLAKCPDCGVTIYGAIDDHICTDDMVNEKNLEAIMEKQLSVVGLIGVKDYKKMNKLEQKIYDDLIKVADAGEYEDMRRELNIYFLGKDI